jgi:hypothetical protein
MEMKCGLSGQHLERLSHLENARREIHPSKHVEKQPSAARR